MLSVIGEKIQGMALCIRYGLNYGKYFRRLEETKTAGGW